MSDNTQSLPSTRPRPRCVVVDIGNTSTGVARYAGGRITRLAHVPSRLRSPAVRAQAAEALQRIAAGGPLEGAIMASVAPACNRAWLALIRRELGLSAQLLTAQTPLPVGIDYPHPESIGADRLANAAGGRIRYGAPVIVADFGTALTFDIVSEKGYYIGGVIAPGLPLMTDYLYEKTALLPRLRLGGRCPPIGRSTVGAMTIGARIGYRGIVRETVRYIEQSLAKPAHLCVTGGYARWAMRGIDLPYSFDPDLTLFGLGCIFEGNRL